MSMESPSVSESGAPSAAPGALSAASPAGFWIRFGARLIDTLILLPWNLGSYWLTSSNRNLAILVSLIFFPVASIYFIFCHHRWGQTVGKMVFRIRVVSADGGKLSLIESVLRSSVDLGFASLLTAFSVMGVLAIPPDLYATLGWQEQARMMIEAVPAINYTNRLNTLWAVLNSLVLAAHPRKLALHDLLARTRVERLNQPTSF